MPQDSSFLGTKPVVVAPATVSYLEITRCSAKWSDLDHTSVDLTAEGFIRNQYRAVRLTARGWQTVQADGDAEPKPALVIYVEEVASTYPGNVPRGFFTLDNFPSPSQLSNPSNLAPEVVFCGLEPGADLKTPPAAGRLKRTRLRI